MRAALAIGIVAIAAFGAAGAASLSPRVESGTVRLDYGDAPDGASASYAKKPRVRGRFPSRSASEGPRHPATGPRIGMRWTGEANSRQVDADTDDGAQLNPRSCAVSTLSVAIDASRVDASAPIYVNAWFDWNQDGDWADGGTRRCGPEWGVQNLEIDPATLGDDRVAVVTLRFRAGQVPSQFWWRVQVHSGAPAPHKAGAGEGPTSGGETEDLFFNRLPPPDEDRIRVRCDQIRGTIPHGGTYTADFTLVGVAGQRVSITRVSHSVFGWGAGIELRRFGVGDRHWWVKARSTRKHDRKPPIQPVGINLDIEALVNGRKRTFSGACGFLVVHSEPVAPPLQPPAVTTPAFGVVIDPDRPNPATAGCRLRFEPEGFTPGAVGATGGIVSAQCDAVGIKSISVYAGSGSQKIASFVSLNTCATTLAGRALRCTYVDDNRGFRVAFSYRTALPFGSTRVHVLAGGSTGGTGTSIVLLQDFFFPREGMTCRQPVPPAATCAAL